MVLCWEVQQQTQLELDATAKTLKENVDVPIVLFPGNISGVSSIC